MVYTCEAAGCYSHTSKKKNIEKYPWMADLTWVKFPRNDNQGQALARWKRLIRRGGKVNSDENVVDILNINKRSRLCSRHFDKEDIDGRGFSSKDPKYFTWNNWGQPTKPRSSKTTEKLQAARRPQPETQSTTTSTATSMVAQDMQEVNNADIPDMAAEVTVPLGGRTNIRIGRVIPLAGHKEEEHPQPIDHDYLCSVSIKMSDASVQTSMTIADINSLEMNQTCAPKPGQDVVDFATETDERVNYYTGLPSRNLLHGIYDSICDGVADHMKYWNGSSSAEEKNYERAGKRRPGRQHTLSQFFQFVMCLIRLRLNLPHLVIADMFDISMATVTRITVTWISYLHQTIVPALLVWPSQESVRQWMPLNFKPDFANTRVVIDASEFYIDRPANKEEQYKTFSQYKSHNTYKVLFGTTPYGAFTFVSNLWSGNTSDRYLTEHCGLVDLIEGGDAVMADRGFHIEDILLTKNATLIAPPFTRKWNNGKGKRLNVKEIRRTRQIARLRIHIERAIQRVKCFRILKHQIPYSLQNCASMIVKVVAALCNLKGPLFYSKNERKLKESRAIVRRPIKRKKKEH